MNELMNCILTVDEMGPDNDERSEAYQQTSNSAEKREVPSRARYPSRSLHRTPQHDELHTIKHARASYTAYKRLHEGLDSVHDNRTRQIANAIVSTGEGEGSQMFVRTLRCVRVWVKRSRSQKKALKRGLRVCQNK